MPRKLVLLEKVYGSFSPKNFEPTLKSMCKGLKIKLKVLGATKRGWIQLEISGEDETVATHFLNREVGLAPISTNKLTKFSTWRGKIISPRKSEMELYVDIGVISPEPLDVKIPLKTLQAQLVDGGKIALKRITELFSLYQNFPLEIKLTNLDVKRGVVEAELSESQHAKFRSWITCALDRLIVLGASLPEVKKAIQKSKHHRDTVEIESLGLLEHAVACKLGTDAKGLIPELGALLQTATLAPFSPTRILQLANGWLHN